MQVQFLGTPPTRNDYLDLVCGSAAEALATLEKCEWAKVTKGSLARMHACGAPHSVDITPYAKGGVRVTITA